MVLGSIPAGLDAAGPVSYGRYNFALSSGAGGRYGRGHTETGSRASGTMAEQRSEARPSARAEKRQEPRFVVGPILLFRGVQGDRWRVSALFVLEGPVEPGDLTVEGVGLPVPPRHLTTWRSRHLWRFDFAVPRQETSSRVQYGFDQRQRWTFTVPGRNERPHIGFLTNNGVEEAWRAERAKGGRNARWLDLAKLHVRSPYHLLIHGGNQIYADTLWEACPSLGAWSEQEADRRNQVPFSQAMADQLMDYYGQAYCAQWQQPEVAAVLAAVPAIMAWNDHDIFAGWGTYPDATQNSQIFRGIFQVAKRHCSFFQLGAPMREPPECLWGAVTASFAQGFHLGEWGILTLDMRSERTRRTVFSDKTWEQIPEWVNRFQGVRHLLVVIGVPLAYPAMGWTERVLRVLPGFDHHESVLRDQWRSPDRAKECVRLVRLLSDFGLRNRCRVTVLSGGTNVAAQGMIHGNGIDLRQLVSSGMVHPPPSSLAVSFLERAAARVDPVANEFNVEMAPFAETGRRIVRARNWLDLSFDKQNRLIGQWHAATTPSEYGMTV